MRRSSIVRTHQETPENVNFVFGIFKFAFFIPVVLITGGLGSRGDHLDQFGSEIYDPITKTSCVLPNLPKGRYSHTQDGLLICGGFDEGGGVSEDTPLKTCLTWNHGIWNVSHHLSSRRSGHSSWTSATNNKTYLMGGNQQDYRQSTEIVGPDGSVEEGFDLHYGTM